MRHLLPAMLLLALPAYADEPFRRSVSVSGEGRIEAAPDRAVITVSIDSRDKVLTAAKKKNDDAMRKFMAAVEAYKLPKENLRTLALSSAPQYRYEQNSGKQIFEQYQVNRTLEIKLDAIDQTEKLIASINEAGAAVNGVQYTLAKPEQREAEARKLAMADAKAKAQMLAESGGAKLGPVLTINLQEGGYPRPMPMMRAMAAKADMAESAPEPLPGLSTIQQNVSVVYELQ